RAKARSSRGRRGVMQKAQHGIKYVAAGEKPAEYLGIVAVQPLAPEFHRMLAGQDREVVSQLNTFEDLIDLRFEEEGRAKTESRGEAHGSVCRHIGRHRRARTVLPRKAEVALIHLPGRDGSEDIQVDGIDLGRSFDAVGRISVGGNIKSLV